MHLMHNLRIPLPTGLLPGRSRILDQHDIALVGPLFPVGALDLDIRDAQVGGHAARRADAVVGTQAADVQAPDPVLPQNRLQVRADEGRVDVLGYDQLVWPPGLAGQRLGKGIEREARRAGVEGGIRQEGRVGNVDDKGGIGSGRERTKGG